LSRFAGVSKACHPEASAAQPKDRRRNPERSEGSLTRNPESAPADEGPLSTSTRYSNVILSEFGATKERRRVEGPPPSQRCHAVSDLFHENVCRSQVFQSLCTRFFLRVPCAEVLGLILVLILVLPLFSQFLCLLCSSALKVFGFCFSPCRVACPEVKPKDVSVVDLEVAA
jgi:hypothetical protein